jgi:hypothetical protein
MEARLDIDMTLLSELYHAIEADPSAIEPRKILIEQYINANWDDSATGAIEELYTLCPYDSEVLSWRAVYCAGTPSTAPPPLPPLPPQRQYASGAYKPTNNLVKLLRQLPARRTHASGASSSARASSRRYDFPLPVRERSHPTPRTRVTVPRDANGITVELSRLQERYAIFRHNAESLLRDTMLLQNLDSGKGKKKENVTTNSTTTTLEHLAAGRITSALQGWTPSRLRTGQARSKSELPERPGSFPKPPRDLARHIEANRQNAFHAVMEDLENMARMLRQLGQPTDTVREQLAQCVQATAAALPQELKIYPQIAMMHLEHEMFEKNYVNKVTMVEGDDVASIPRARFLSTEDGYAWDMVMSPQSALRTRN